VLEGEATLDVNFSLSDKELEEGYVLTCQAHPVTSNITVDYDQG
jgi:ring-1,2-phenylacetyl-CoA epoxidase subunit PaaE